MQARDIATIVHRIGHDGQARRIRGANKNRMMPL